MEVCPEECNSVRLGIPEITIHTSWTEGEPMFQKCVPFKRRNIREGEGGKHKQKGQVGGGGRSKTTASCEVGYFCFFATFDCKRSPDT
eukprot:4449201-Amphidinium_carterae.1